MKTRIEAYSPGTRTKPLVDQVEPNLGTSVILHMCETRKDVDIYVTNMQYNTKQFHKCRGGDIVFIGNAYYMLVYHDDSSDDEYTVYKTHKEACDESERLARKYARGFDDLDWHTEGCFQEESSFFLHVEEIWIPI